MKRGLRLAKLVSKYFRHGLRAFVAWWSAYDRKYRAKWRLANAAVALLVIVSIVLPVLQANWTNKRYQLNSDTLALVGQNNQALADKLQYNAKTATYEFNKDAVKEFNPADPASMQVGGGGKDTKSLYALDVPTDFKKGVTYHDVNSQTSFSLIPQFASLPGKTEQGRIIFPLDGGPQAVYTLKNNGLKEDIVVSGNKQASLRFSYKLQLPKTLEAKPLPDHSGGIGIYGGDPALFSDMSYGSDADRALVEKARQNAEKTNLLYGIPAPTIMAKDGKVGSASARFELNGDTLTVVAENLGDVHGTFSLDPSVVVTASSDFTSSGNNDGNIDFTAAGQISRNTLTGGTVPSWSDQTSATGGGTSVAGATTIAYDGYMYQLASSTSGGTGYYAAINSSDGSVGSFTSQASSITVTTATIYNGYVYALSGNGASSLVSYAQIQANHSLGAWQTATPLATAVGQTKIVAYNGYLYVASGCTAYGVFCNTTTTSTQYVAVNADGSLGASWTTSSTNLAQGRWSHAVTAYNGYLYVAGGQLDGAHSNQTVGTVEYAPINADGSVGTWASATSMPSNMRQFNLVAANGYLYVLGGDNNSTPVATAYYAPIYANGSLGVFNTTTALIAARSNSGNTYYNGYLYNLGGNNTSAGSPQSDIMRAKIDTSGTTSGYSAAANYDGGNGRFLSGVVATGGYLYIIGGASNGTSATEYASTRYAPINADGSLGTWTTGSSFNNTQTGTGTFCATAGNCPGRKDLTAAAYNGYLYIAGGQSNGTGTYWSDVQSAPLNPTTGAPGSWTTLYDDFTTNSTTTYSNTNGEAGMAMQIYNGYMYLVGGVTNNNNVLSPKIYYASVTSSGGVGTFATTTGLPGDANNGGQDLSVFVAGGKFYVASGRVQGSAGNCNSPIGGCPNYIQFTTINSDGSLGNGNTTTSWTDANAVANGGSGSTYSTTLAKMRVILNNDYVYVVGGMTGTNGAGTNPAATVYRARLNANGSLGIWTTTTSFSGGRFWPGTVASNGNLYVMAGCDQITLTGGCNAAADYLPDYQYAQINNGGGGDMTAWSTSTAFSSNTARYKNKTVAYNGYLYVLGGFSVGTGTLITSGDTVIYAPINGDGTIGSWSQTNKFDTTQNLADGASFLAYNGYMYKIAGRFNSTFYRDVQFAPINSSNGSLGTWQYTYNGGIGVYNSGGLQTARESFGAVVSGGYMYVMGGCTSVSSSGYYCDNSGLNKTVEAAQVNADGTVGAWTALTGKDFDTGRKEAQAIANNGYVYLVGGCTATDAFGNCTAAGNSTGVQFAKLSGNTLAANAGCGSVWCVTGKFDTYRLNFGLAVQNGFLYVVGGQLSSGSPTGITQYAPIMSNGYLGQWAQSKQVMSTAAHSFGSATYHGTTYVAGGCTNAVNNCTGGGLSTVQYASLQAVPRTAHYSKLIDLGRSTNIRGISYTSATDPVSLSYQFAGSNASFGTTATTVTPTGTCTGSGQQTRYVELMLSIDDSTAAAFGEASGSSVADITVQFYYTHPTPQTRLHGGKTLQAGELTPLDTCGSMAP